MVAKIEAPNEWEAVIEEAKWEAEAIRDSIKAEMMERDTEELAAGKHIVRWSSVLPTSSIPPLSRRCTVTSIKPSPSRARAAASPSAHKENPLA